MPLKGAEPERPLEEAAQRVFKTCSRVEHARDNPGARAPGRARIFVDGEFWAEIDADVAVERGLREGAALGLEELEAARVAGERALAMNRALHFLGYRARSRSEVRERLRRYGYGEETVGAVIGRLEELGYLDDEEFARTVVREKARRYGPRRVSADLRRSGWTPSWRRASLRRSSPREASWRGARSAARRYNRRRIRRRGA